MSTLVNTLLLAAAGAAGTLLRAGCNGIVGRLLGTGFPWATLAINVLGSFTFGALYALARSRTITAEQEVVLLVGLLGGFTTYSTFAFHALDMLTTARIIPAIAYIVSTNLLGLAAVWLGLRAFR